MTELFYVLDTDDRIIGVGENWDTIANERGAADVLSSRICGRRIWDFVTGFETETFLRAALFQTRTTRRCFVFEYSVGSWEPGNKFVMCIVPETNGDLTVYHCAASVEWCTKSVGDQPIKYAICACSICYMSLHNSFDISLRQVVRKADSGCVSDFLICRSCRTQINVALDSMPQIANRSATNRLFRGGPTNLNS